ncbi:DUF2795 domain-containing protein [Streptomyces palmae]|uniref:DUF2795 domain-containing protein n=1 Tax=Streptomyces palmae TaxID=1701085 RepID=A0A4Z0HFQ6_9ACTN|nr:DUF2795 domain-containing protein [Streptomyces palmae]TGB17390.1 DUF2795 domain-containing protein [Streptomyces palmae]
MAATDPTKVQKALKGAHYPTDKRDLEQLAKKNGADDQIVKSIHNAKRDSFDSPAQVQEEIFGS